MREFTTSIDIENDSNSLKWYEQWNNNVSRTNYFKYSDYLRMIIIHH